MLENLGTAIRRAAAEATAEACAQVRDTAKTLCPVDSGQLRESIHVAEAAGGVGATGTVTASVPYAAAVELGTLRQSARPYLQPALAQAKEGLAAAVVTRIRAAL